MMSRYLNRDRLAVVAAIAVPLALAVILVPFRSGFPNTDAALALIVVVVAVATNGDRLAGVLAAGSAAVWFDFFLTQPYERFSITSRDASRPPSCCWSSGWRSPSWPSGDAISTPPRTGVPATSTESAAPPGRGHGPLGVHAGRAGDRPAHRAADAAIVRVSVRRRRARRQAGSGMTVRSPWSSGSGMWIRRVPRRA